MASYSWATGVNGDWNVAADWTPAGPPNDPAADVTIDAATATNYTVTIAAGEQETVRSLTMNGVTNLAGSNKSPYNAAQLAVNGTLTFGAGSPGSLDGSLQTFVTMNGGTIVNPGTINGFIQAQGSNLFTGTNGFYVTNWLQALAGTVVIDTKSIAEMTGTTLFDGIFEAKGPGALIDLGGPRQNLAVNITTVEGPPAIPEGWTELILNGTATTINEWNGTAYVPIESTLSTITSRGTVDVLDGRNYTTTNTLSVNAGGLLNLNAGTVTAAAIDINGGVVQGFGTITNGITNNGTLLAEGGKLDLLGALSGTGTVKFDIDQRQGTISATGGTLEVHGVAAGQTLTMNGNDTLMIDTPAAFAGTIAAKSGDTIDLTGVTATTAVLQGQTLLVENGSTTVASLQLSGSYTGDSFAVSAITGGSAVKIGGASGGPNVSVVDITNNTTVAAGGAYSGPVAGLQSQYISFSPDALNIKATAPNSFIHGGIGNDTIDVSGVNGNNVLDGFYGTNLLIGGTGRDTFYAGENGMTQSVTSTAVNFHSGDNATIWGVNKTDFTMTLTNNAGPAGHTGVAVDFTAPGKPSISLVLAGFTSADFTNGRLTQSYGTTPDLPGAPGSPFFNIHAV